jgi:hypothetical protein
MKHTKQQLHLVGTHFALEIILNENNNANAKINYQRSMAIQVIHEVGGRI